MISGLNTMFQGSRTMQANQMLQSLGISESVGQAIGAGIVETRTDWTAAANSLVQMTSNIGQSDMDRLFGKGLPESHYISNPYSVLPRNRRMWGQNFYAQQGAHFAYKGGRRGAFNRQIARSFEFIATSNVKAKFRMEQVLGGTIIADGRQDGRVTIQRYTPYSSSATYSDDIAGSPMKSGLFGSLAKMENNILNVANGLTKGGANSPNWEFANGDMAGAAKSMGINPPLNFEDLLFVQMQQYAIKKEHQIMGKMNELSQNQPASATPQQTQQAQQQAVMQGLARVLAGNPNVSGSPFGGLVGGPTSSPMQAFPAGTNAQNIMASLFPQGGVGGVGAGGVPISGAGGIPISGGTAGFPISGGTAGLPGSTGATGATGTSGYNPLDPQQSDMAKQAMLQKMVQDLQKMYQLLTNVQKSMHDMAMGAIRNIR